jgi:hypothetical protein
MRPERPEYEKKLAKGLESCAGYSLQLKVKDVKAFEIPKAGVSMSLKAETWPRVGSMSRLVKTEVGEPPLRLKKVPVGHPEWFARS